MINAMILYVTPQKTEFVAEELKTVTYATPPMEE